ncbi:hypothetical protein [Streptomyces niveus]|uniref:hypothetical protein n=1 Tax=Streptomyces niveus TaxID=193462 RepID=UPI003414382E
MPESTVRSGRTWQLWLALYVACSMVVCLVVTLLVLRAGAGTTDAVLAGGGGFATSLALCLALPAAVRELKRQADPDRG